MSNRLDIQEGDYFINVGPGQYTGEIYRLLMTDSGKFLLVTVVGTKAAFGAAREWSEMIQRIIRYIENDSLNRINPKFTVKREKQ